MRDSVGGVEDREASSPPGLLFSFVSIGQGDLDVTHTKTPSDINTHRAYTHHTHTTPRFPCHGSRKTSRRVRRASQHPGISA